MLKISEEALVVLDVRLGRTGKAVEFFGKHPNLLNEKIFPASEMGYKTTHSFVDLAVNFGHLSLLKWGMSQGAVCSPSSSPSLLLLATSQKNGDICSFLLDQNFDPWLSPPLHTPTTPLSVAVSLNWLDGLKQWKKKGVSLKSDKTDKTLYHDLFSNIHNFDAPSIKEMMTFLLKEKVVLRPDQTGLMPQDVVSTNQPHYKKLAQTAMVLHDEYICLKTKKMIVKSLPKEKAPKKAKKM